MDEFEEACRLLGQHTASVIPREHVIAMARNMDLNKDGRHEHLQTARRTTCQRPSYNRLNFLHKDFYKSEEQPVNEVCLHRELYYFQTARRSSCELNVFSTRTVR